jgi:hypothetical protein
MQAAECGGTLVVAGGAHRVGFDGGPGAGTRNEAFAPGGVVAEGCGAAPAAPAPAAPAPPVPAAPAAPAPPPAAAQPPPVRATAPPRACDRTGRDTSRTLLRASLTRRTVSPRTPARVRLTLRARAELCLAVERRTRSGSWRALPGRLVRRASAGTSTRGLHASFAGRRLRPGAHRLTLVAQAADGRRTTARLRFSVIRPNR